MIYVQYASVASYLYNSYSPPLVIPLRSACCIAHGTEHGFWFGEPRPIVQWGFFYQKLSCLENEDTMALYSQYFPTGVTVLLSLLYVYITMHY
jgi:hypothetical protein